MQKDPSARPRGCSARPRSPAHRRRGRIRHRAVQRHRRRQERERAPRSFSSRRPGAAARSRRTGWRGCMRPAAACKADPVEAVRWHLIAKAGGDNDLYLDEFMRKSSRPNGANAAEKAAKPWIDAYWRPLTLLTGPHLTAVRAARGTSAPTTFSTLNGPSHGQDQRQRNSARHGDRVRGHALGRGEDHGGEARQGPGLQPGRAQEHARRPQAQPALRHRRPGRATRGSSEGIPVPLQAGRSARVHGSRRATSRSNCRKISSASARPSCRTA